LKGERDNNRLARDEPASDTPMCKGWCARDILWSAISVEEGDGEPCVSEGARVIEVLETTEVPENGHIGTEAFPPTERGQDL